MSEKVYSVYKDDVYTVVVRDCGERGDDLDNNVFVDPDDLKTPEFKAIMRYINHNGTLENAHAAFDTLKDEERLRDENDEIEEMFGASRAGIGNGYEAHAWDDDSNPEDYYSYETNDELSDEGYYE